MLGSAGQFDLQAWLWAGVGLLVLGTLLSRSPRPRRVWWITGIGALNLSFVALQRHPGQFFVPWLCSALLLAAVSWPTKAGRTVAVWCLLAAGFWSSQTALQTQDLPLRWTERSTRALPGSSVAFLGEINAVFPVLYSRVVQHEPPELTLYPIWNSTRSQHLQTVQAATGAVFVDMDLVDFAKRTGQAGVFSDIVPDPVLLRVHRPDSLNWEMWWDSEREWLRRNQPHMTRLDRLILGKHYFNLGVFCLEHNIPIGETLLGIARGLNPELPKIE
jgi:hypothetical protein